MVELDERGIIEIGIIAEWFLNKSTMTHRKLQKLCYYAEAWRVALFKEKLYKDTQFEGWLYGPVSPDLYQKYKGYGWRDIPQEENIRTVDEGLEEFLEVIYSTYKELNGIELSELSHQEQPWINSRVGIPENEGGNIILSLEDMYEYFTELGDSKESEV